MGLEEQYGICGQVVEMLRALAAEPDEQVAFINDFGVGGEPVDELALEFDRLYGVIRTNPDLAWRYETARPTLDRIDASFAQMSGEQNFEKWTFDALRRSPEWSELRDLAKTALSQLEESGGS